jgi:hypothetical protein
MRRHLVPVRDARLGGFCMFVFENKLPSWSRFKSKLRGE